MNLLMVLEAAKARSMARLAEYTASRVPLSRVPAQIAAAQALVGPDPFPYGLAANQPTLDALLGWAQAERRNRSALAAREAVCAADAEPGAGLTLLAAPPLRAGVLPGSSYHIAQGCHTMPIRSVLHLACMLLALIGAGAHAAPGDAVTELAPTGRLRAAINFGNPVLAQRRTDGTAQGVSVALAQELGRRLGVPVDLVPFNEAGQVFAAARSGGWDVAFLAIDPVRAAAISFTPPYVVIEGAYLVLQASPLHAPEDADRDGARIAVAEGSAYDLYLTRTLHHAALLRFPDTAAATKAFMQQHLDSLAGVRQPLVAFAAAHPEARVLPGAFMQIEQAMGNPQGHPAGALFLRAFVEEMKASGFVARALSETGQGDAAVAPAAGAE